MYPPLVLFSVTALCTSNTFSNTFLVFEFLGYACFSGACLPEMAEALEPQGIQRDTMGAQMTSCDIALGTGSQEVAVRSRLSPPKKSLVTVMVTRLFLFYRYRMGSLIRTQVRGPGLLT